jgi:uncharacterized protein YkwD
MTLFAGAFLHTADERQELRTEVLSNDIYTLINKERRNNNAKIVAFNSKLMEAAQNKAAHMAKNGYFSHSSPDGKPFTYWINQSGYEYLFAAENLAVKFLHSSSIINAWMHSASHRKTLLNPKYSEIGIGIAMGQYKKEKSIFVVVMFGEAKLSKAN